MTAVRWPDHLLTLDEWDALGSDGAYRWTELLEGVVQVTPSRTVKHQVAQLDLLLQLDRARPDAMGVVGAVDVVLAADFPPTVRQPDVVVVPAAVLEGPAKRLCADDVQLAIEIMARGSRRLDRIMKSADYADAGIPNYWILDVDGPVSLDVLQLADGGYEPVALGATGTIELQAPFPVTLELDALAHR